MHDESETNSNSLLGWNLPNQVPRNTEACIFFISNQLHGILDREATFIGPYQYLKSPTVSSSINLWEAIILRIFGEKRCPKLSYFQSLSSPHISSTKAPSIYVGMAPSVASRSGVLAGGPTMVPKKRVSSIAYVHH